MQNGSKYIPPHLRNSQGGGGSSTTKNNDYGSDNYKGVDNRDQPRANYGSSSRAGYGSSRSGGGSRAGYGSLRGGGGGSYRESRGPPRDQYPPPGSDAPPQTNSRWSNVDLGRESGGGGGKRYDDRGGGGGGYRRDSYAPRRNERGFHGDMRPDKRLERELFEQELQQTTGINFDNYDNIPVESSGNDIPDPIEHYSEDTIGEDLARNAGLCGYTKPTPVQKWSVPIGTAGRDLMACAQTGRYVYYATFKHIFSYVVSVERQPDSYFQ